MSDLHDASTMNWCCHSCFRLFGNSVQATHTARKGAICPDCFNAEPMFSKAQLTQALATHRADLAEQVRGLDVQASDYESNLISLPEVLAILEVGE